MAPTRELAQQIEKEFVKLSEDTHLRSVVIVGGKSAEEQGSIISRGVEVVIGTPGRIEDFLTKRTLVLNQCYFVVLDEADKMIDYNLEDSVNAIIAAIPEHLHKADDENLVKQQEHMMMNGEKNFKTFLMFSATMQPLVEKMARMYLKCPSFIQVGEIGDKKTIEQRIEFVTHDSQRKQKLMQILNRDPQAPIIIFVNLIADVDHLHDHLTRAGKRVTLIHGKKSQEQREKGLNALRDGFADILVCTNVVARGIDIDSVAHVINYNAPANITEYIHRIGRTGRAGK